MSMSTNTNRQFRQAIYAATDDNVLRITLLLKRIRLHGGRVWVRLDSLVPGMPAIILGWSA